MLTCDVNTNYLFDLPSFGPESFEIAGFPFMKVPLHESERLHPEA